MGLGVVIIAVVVAVVVGIKVDASWSLTTISHNSEDDSVSENLRDSIVKKQSATSA